MTAPSPTAPGARLITPTGSELVPVIAGGPISQIMTAQSVADLNPVPQLMTAAGATQGTATLITNKTAIVTVATTVSTKGVKLPAASTGALYLVACAASFGVKVYPFAGGKIGAAATNVADTTLAKNKANLYIGVNKTLWVVQRGS
jgi:hypothetical protein